MSEVRITNTAGVKMFQSSSIEIQTLQAHYDACVDAEMRIALRLRIDALTTGIPEYIETLQSRARALPHEMAYTFSAECAALQRWRESQYDGQSGTVREEVAMLDYNTHKKDGREKRVAFWQCMTILEQAGYPVDFGKCKRCEHGSEIERALCSNVDEHTYKASK